MEKRALWRAKRRAWTLRQDDAELSRYLISQAEERLGRGFMGVGDDEWLEARHAAEPALIEAMLAD